MSSSSPRFPHRLRTAAFAAVVGVLGALPASAAGTGPDLGLGYATAIGLTTTDIRTTVSRIISYFLGFLGIIAVGIMLYAGFLWMTAGGSEEKVGVAKKWMVNGAIGLAIITSAFAITQFIFRAVEEGSQGAGGVGGCPPGQVCGGGFGGGGLGTFKLAGITPFGPGPGDKGWPKNYSIQAYFNATLAAPALGAPVPPSWITVTKCNKRVDGAGKPLPFDNTACSAAVDGVRTVSGSKLLFKANPAPPGQFDGDFWYFVRIQGGGVKDASGRTLTCPFTPPGPTGDIASASARADLCDRAVAINDLVDVTPPTVTVDAPKSPPAYCGSIAVGVHAIAQDDFLVAGVDFLLDGGTDRLVDVNGDPLSSDVNSALDNPFTASSINVDIATLNPGPHKITAVAQDGVPQASAAAVADFTLNPPHCCNAVKDDAQGETGIDCGGECGACDGSACAKDADCSSGFCDPKTSVCQQMPVIDSVTPMAAGVGTLVTIKGRWLGTSPGSVTFLGGPGDTDDVLAQACSSSAWTDTEVVVAVPTGAVTGPLKLTAFYGQSDRTDDERGPNLGSFTVSGSVLPGICYLSPDQGVAGMKFDINGGGFGASIGSSTVAMGSYAPTVATGGWTDAKVSVIAPPAPEKTYPVTVTVGGKTSNPVNFLIAPPSAAGTPHIVQVIPDSGPVGSYVTIQGSGFGYLKGKVLFKNGKDSAYGEDPVCDENWHENYVIVKVPREYMEGAGPLSFGPIPGIAHKVQLVTAPPSKSSNDDVVFGVTNEPPRPGICSIVPDNGRPGKGVQVSGEGFGEFDASKAGPASTPRYSAEFFKSKMLRCTGSAAACGKIGEACTPSSDGVCAPTTVTSNAYSAWHDTGVGTIVAGDYLAKATWPATGPVYLLAKNQLSSNAVPFTVGDCNESGATCPTGKQCCANGSCQDSCIPPPRTSAYGWLFSTNVLPDLPVVIENALCRHDPLPEILQSPSPFKDSTDACKNAEGRVEFSTYLQMDPGSLLASVKLEECGSGDKPASCAPVTNLQFFPRDCDDPPTDEQCKVLAFIPPATYNAGTSFFKNNTWYRVTLKSDPSAGIGFKEPVTAGRYLNGDFDNKTPGGDYVYSFRVSPSDTTCALASVFVDAPKDIIDQDTNAVNFQSLPTGTNCNSLQCGPGLYSLKWTADPTFLVLLSPPPVPPNSASSFCTQPVLAKLETPHTPLDATMATLGTSLLKTGTSDVTVKFADPHVIEVAPTAGCIQACINSLIEARFNVPMDPATLTSNTVEMLQCRNASCTAPYLPLGGVVRSVTPEPPDRMIGVTKIYKHVDLTAGDKTGFLKPGVFYIVRIRGGAAGVKSRSGVPLAGLNDGNFYSWQFRTKDDPTACLASRAAISPPESTLYFVGERRGLTVKAFGSPDECNKSGQELLADAFSWSWSFDAPNRVLGGFIDGDLTTPVSPSPPRTVVNTDPVPKQECTAQCLLRGSQNVLPQCGDGIVEKQYEECDPPGGNCSEHCLFIGTPKPTCGNGKIDPGETCDTALRCVGGANEGKACAVAGDCPGGDCKAVFPLGCKDPDAHVDGFADSLGCVNTGSSTTGKRSTCGDGFIGDGESCDDGNSSNGDGCSADCLKEGTNRSCAATGPGEPCTNFCGNGKTEPGEDPDCEKPPSPSANGCNPATCLKRGLPPCANPSDTMCCGNKKAESGEDPVCETDPKAGEFCTATCILKGSSPFYTEASFCGDNIVGKGERADCEQMPDKNIDRYQVTVAEPQPGFDSKTAVGSSSVVLSTTAGIDPGSQGRAKVALSCTCKSKGDQAAQDAWCGTFGAKLACADNGCCASRPEIVLVVPPDGKNPTCRNPAIHVTFNQVMESASLAQNVLVGVDNGTSDCPAGSAKITLGPGGSAAGGTARGFWNRLWGALASFFDEYVVRPVFGDAPTPFPTGHTFCSVKAAINAIPVGEPPTATTTNINIEHVFPPDTWVVVRVLPAAKAVSGVAVGGGGNTFHFGAGKDVCTVGRVNITPASLLFSSVNQAPEKLTAHAYTSSDEDIMPTIEYPWSWDWTPQPPTSSAVLDSVLDSKTGLETENAHVRVRGSSKDDKTTPKNGEAVAEGAAVAAPFACKGGSKAGSSCKVDGDCAGGACKGTRYAGTADVTVFLCDNPWPDRKVCDVTKTVKLPWDPGSADACIQNARYWYPFYDPSTNFKFYYCRDGQGIGDAAATLPALRETPAVVQPGRDILKEYLFTYDTSVFAPNGRGWEKDAIGLRISANPGHLGIASWYSGKGFQGAPQSKMVDGYDALQDGRTVYVGGAAMTSVTPKAKLYTNIDTLSYTDGAAPETLGVFNQILSFIDFNRNKELQDRGICRDLSGGDIRCTTDEDCHVNSAGVPVVGLGDHTCDIPTGLCLGKDLKADPKSGVALACGADVDCQVGRDGKFLLDKAGKPARVGFTCDVPKTKLARDVRRWADLQALRSDLLGHQGEGTLPKLDSGTFLVTLSNSTWPSWQGKLGLESGLNLPSDPVNRHGYCDPAARDAGTCWSDKTRDYQCPAQSHVYRYEYFQENAGSNFRLRADFENGSDDTKVWAGTTCLELGDSVACGKNTDCVWESGACNFKVGKMHLGGVNPVSPQCSGVKESSGGICGDGLVNPAAGEKCEPGQEQAASCTKDGRSGSIAQVCKPDCKGWDDKKDAKCETGKCGDGVVQAPEACDDGPLNGAYGHCNTSCSKKDFFCGDGKKSPNEKCDCKDLNGQYFLNGVTAPALENGVDNFPACGSPSDKNTPSCAWDCSGPGPRCGDGIINGDEICDGGFQEFKGYCDPDPNKTGCNGISDCPADKCVASACSLTSKKCSSDTDCEVSKCQHFCPKPEQMNHRVCNSNNPADASDDAAACTWGTWACTAPGFCGNGKQEVGEQCDDGNTDNTDSCVIDPMRGVMCKKAVCGDGYVDPAAGEQCDEGSNNNRPCKPQYGLNCTFCQSSCKTATVSGGFCGDNIVEDAKSDPPGPEQCDGALGLSSEWVCISTKDADQSANIWKLNNSNSNIGCPVYPVMACNSQGKRITGYAICAKNNCQRACAVADSAVCHQRLVKDGGTDKDTDGDGIADICDPDIDGDGVPNFADCQPYDATLHGSYTISGTELHVDSTGCVPQGQNPR